MKTKVTEIEVSDETVVAIKKVFESHKEAFAAHMKKYGTPKGFKKKLSFSN